MIELFAHNRIAYESAVKMLSEVGKAAVIHPTGTGTVSYTHLTLPTNFRV